MSRPEIKTAVSASPLGSATQLDNVVCGHTIFIISPTLPETTGQWVIFPTNCEVGDIVECHARDHTETLSFLLPSGDGWLANGNEPTIPPGTSRGFQARKVNATEWAWGG